MTETIKIRCSTCRGTGLVGIPTDEATITRDTELFVEGRHGIAYEGAVCPTCEGTGCKELSYVPFSGRTILGHIKSVLEKYGGRMTYGEFIKSVREPTRDD